MACETVELTIGSWVTREVGELPMWATGWWVPSAEDRKPRSRELGAPPSFAFGNSSLVSSARTPVMVFFIFDFVFCSDGELYFMWEVLFELGGL